ncbi:unnamed protein product [Phaedon cochleariae]|uniref:Zinc finger PHD-type domain-containing protein n=1 Tax=Phaedon cochleariae TaxID=80249 RepID=A0A9N9X138_PHACE|nr:unnamed protein product [Phaedon cochleariae]
MWSSEQMEAALNAIHGNEVTPEVHDHNKENETEPAGVSFTDLIPLPGPSGIQTAKKQQCINRKQHSEIFTSTPQKTTLDEKTERKLQNKMKKDAKTNGTKRKLASDEDEPNETQTTTTIRKNPKRTCIEALALTVDNIPEDEDEYDDDSREKEVNEDICIICGDIGKDRELWIRCVVCGQWAHEACAGNVRDDYICDFCL